MIMIMVMYVMFKGVFVSLHFIFCYLFCFCILFKDFSCVLFNLCHKLDFLSDFLLCFLVACFNSILLCFSNLLIVNFVCVSKIQP